VNEISTPGGRELLEKKRAVGPMVQRRAVSMARGADWLLSEFTSAGPMMRERDLSYCRPEYRLHTLLIFETV
jgi:hypothetical protein